MATEWSDGYYSFSRISSATGILSEIVINTIMEEDENDTSQPGVLPEQEARLSPSPSSSSLLPSSADRNGYRSRSNSEGFYSRRFSQGEDLEAGVNSVPDRDGRPDTSDVDKSYTNRLSWLYELEEAFGLVLAPQNTTQSKPTKTIADYTQSPLLNDFSALDHYSEHRFISSDGSQDDQKEEVVKKDPWIRYYSHKHAMAENKRDLLRWRQMKVAEKPHHLLGNYDLWLGRTRNRMEICSLNLTILLRHFCEIEQFVQARLSEIGRKLDPLVA
jgi:hypothetical protein